MSRPRKNPPIIIKICEGCKKEFTISNRKYRQRYCTKSCAQHDPKVLEKMEKSKQKTYDKKYGGIHPMETQKTKNTFKESIFKKYGNDYYTNYLVKKSKQTNLEKYGNENYNNIEKIKQTCLKKYGVDNPMKCKAISNKISTTVYKDHYQYISEYCKNKNIQALFNENDYIGYDFKNKYRFKCNICNTEFESDIYKPQHIFCEICNPSDNGTLENQIFKFISSILTKEIDIKRNDRTILFGKELDIFIPSKKLAIEVNGLYWHSEKGRNIHKLYHLNKSKNCIFHGIRLIHIFENEWIHKNDIIKSILKNILLSTETKINGRECKIKNISNNEKDEFLNKNHIQGSDKSNVKYGLFYKEELISVMTFSKPRFDKKIEWEMIRYCNKIGYSIRGGASKLFNHFTNENNPKSILSYSDRRYFDGTVYLKLGFSFKNNTPPNYYYISNDYKILYNRMNFQKHKLKNLLENFNPTLTEWENMKNHGFDRIWDCGNSKWIWKNQSQP